MWVRRWQWPHDLLDAHDDECDGERDVKPNGELDRHHWPSFRSDGPEAMLIYSMSVSVDGLVADRAGAFGWTVPNEGQFRFHIAQTRELGGHLCGRRGPSPARRRCVGLRDGPSPAVRPPDGMTPPPHRRAG